MMEVGWLLLALVATALAQGDYRRFGGRARDEGGGGRDEGGGGRDEGGGGRLEDRGGRDEGGGGRYENRGGRDEGGGGGGFEDRGGRDEGGSGRLEDRGGRAYPPQESGRQRQPDQPTNRNNGFDFGLTNYGPSQASVGPESFNRPRSEPFPFQGSGSGSRNPNQRGLDRLQSDYPSGRQNPNFPAGQQSDSGRRDPSSRAESREQDYSPQEEPSNDGFFSSGKGLGRSLVPTLGILNGLGSSGSDSGGKESRGSGPSNLINNDLYDKFYNPGASASGGEQDLLDVLGPSARPFDKLKSDNFPKIGDPPPPPPPFKRPEPGVDQYGNPSPYVQNPYPTYDYDPQSKDAKQPSSAEQPASYQNQGDPNQAPYQSNGPSQYGNGAPGPPQVEGNPNQAPYQSNGPSQYGNGAPGPPQAEGNPNQTPYQSDGPSQYGNGPPVPYQNEGNPNQIPYQSNGPNQYGNGAPDANQNGGNPNQTPYQNNGPSQYGNGPPVAYQNEGNPNQIPYQSNGPNQYGNGAPVPYQNQGPSAFQNGAPEPQQNQAPNAFQNGVPNPQQNQAPNAFQNGVPNSYQNQAPNAAPFQNSPGNYPAQVPSQGQPAQASSLFPFPKTPNFFTGTDLFGGNLGLGLFTSAAKSLPGGGQNPNNNQGYSQQTNQYNSQAPQGNQGVGNNYPQPQGNQGVGNNYPQLPTSVPQLPNSVPQQGNNPYPSGPLASLYPTGLPLKQPTQFGNQNANTNLDPSFPIGGQVSPQGPNANQAQFNPSAPYGNPAASPRQPGYPGYPAGVGAGAQPGYPSAQPQGPIVYPAQRTPISQEFSTPQQNPVSYPLASAYPATGSGQVAGQVALDDSQSNVYSSNSKFSDGNAYNKKDEYNNKDGDSAGQQGGYDSRAQFADQDKAQGSFKDADHGSFQDSYNDQQSQTAGNQFSKKNKEAVLYDSGAPLSTAVPVSFGDTPGEDSYTPKRDDLGPPPLHAVPGKTTTTSPKSTPAAGIVAVTESPSEASTDKFDRLKPKKPHDSDFGLDKLFSFPGFKKKGGNLFEKKGFPSFTEALGKELKKLFKE